MWKAMATLHRQILIAYKNLISIQPTYRIQDIVDWINANGGINGCNVNRDQVKRGIVYIIEKSKGR